MQFRTHVFLRGNVFQIPVPQSCCVFDHMPALLWMLHVWHTHIHPKAKVQQQTAYEIIHSYKTQKNNWVKTISEFLCVGVMYKQYMISTKYSADWCDLLLYVCVISFNSEIWQLHCLHRFGKGISSHLRFLDRCRNIHNNQKDLFGINVLKEIEKHF